MISGQRTGMATCDWATNNLVWLTAAEGLV